MPCMRREFPPSPKVLMHRFALGALLRENESRMKENAEKAVLMHRLALGAL